LGSPSRQDAAPTASKSIQWLLSPKDVLQDR
jgi:hypothetical protein